MHPLQLQEELKVFPEAFSTLSLDDADKRADAAQIYAVASQNPVVWNLQRAAQDLASTFRGRSHEELINPPQPPSPPAPEPKIGINVSVKFELLPAQTQQAILQAVGLPGDPHAAIKTATEGIAAMSEASQHLQT